MNGTLILSAGGRLLMILLACVSFFVGFFFLCMFVLFDAFDNVPLTEIAGLSFTHVHGCYFLQMTAFLKS